MTLNDIPLDDEKTWNAFCSGNTKGVFQFASNVALPVIKQIQPRNIEELSAANSFIRPGTSGVDLYVEGKKELKSSGGKFGGQKAAYYGDERIDSVLRTTYGAIVFQEQIMGLIAALMGISFGKADIYRRALEKPNKPANKEKVEYFNKNVVKIAVSLGFKAEVTEKVRKAILDNSGYAFNKCFSGREKIYRMGNQYKSLSIEEMYKIKNDREYAKITKHLALRKKYRNSGYGFAFSMNEEGKLYKNEIVDIYYSGIKKVYKVTTESGNTIECTMNHNFPTPNGKKMLCELNIGDELYVLGENDKQTYIKLNKIRSNNYPKKGQCGFQKNVGDIKNYVFHSYREKCIGKQCELCNNIGKELHHKDGNHDNNVEENFQWLCVSCHKKQHYKMGRIKNYERGLNSKLSKIVSIEYVTTENVYDIEMKAPNHNLLLDNGIIASNSHAVCYSIISYDTAWFKVNYPLIFHKTMLNGNLGDDFGDFMDLAREDGINLLPPEINHSQFLTEISDESTKQLQIGFNCIKGVGGKAVESIVLNRPYNTVNEFFEKNTSKATNKKVIEVLIKAGAFDNLPIEIKDSSIIQKLSGLSFNLKNNLLYLNRKQLYRWYELYLEINNAKQINYAVSVNYLKSKYIDEYELVLEKDNTVIIPESFVDIFELNIKNCNTTRKKPKGKLKELISTKINIDIFSKPFIKNSEEINNINVNQLEMYVEESENNGFSFTPHPLCKYANKINSFKEAQDGDNLIEVGIITSLEEKKTKNGKKFYYLFIKSPLESIRITLWSNQFKTYKNIISKYNLIAVKGIKGYGSISCQDMKTLKKS